MNTESLALFEKVLQRGETLISENREILGHLVARFINDFELITRCDLIFYYSQIQIVVNPFTKNKLINQTN